MITCFPDFYPDEIFYSACARFSERMQYPDKRSIVQQLFSTGNAIASVLLPSHLGNFIATLSDSYAYTADFVIDHHTALPYYSVFLPAERLSRIRSDMVNGDGRGLYMKAGLTAGRIPVPSRLRFCPLCAKEDKEQFGECYWHRLHQIPGVEVCPLHYVFMKESTVPTANNRIRHAFVAAESNIEDLLPESLDLTNRRDKTALHVAQDVRWLLEQKDLNMGTTAFRDRYLTALATKGLATFSGTVRMAELSGKFKEHHSLEGLSLLHCELQDNVEENWLTRILHTSNEAQPPICYLLMINFLGYSLETFTALPRRCEPFGNGPWPCLNIICDRYRQPCITKCQVTYGKHSGGQPTGIFSCTCGFVYSRKGPDQTDKDYFRIGKLISFGDIWKQSLRELSNDSSLSLREVARRLGVDPATVKSQLAQLELTQIDTDGIKMDIAHQNNPERRQKLRDQCRMQWLSGVEQASDSGIKALRAKIPKIYIWLYRNDREWLLQHLPARKAKSSLPAARVDWRLRDIELSTKVKLSAEALKRREGMPVQLTITSICRETGQPTLVEKYQDKLPKTMETLSKLVETRPEWAIRRLWWAASYFKREGIIPTKWQLIKKAGVERLISDPAVQNTIQEILSSFFHN